MFKITIVNNTKEVVRVAIFKKPVKQPTLSAIAWRIADPPPVGGQTIIQIPNDYGIYANYSFDESGGDYPDGEYRTNIINFSELTARFIVERLQNKKKDVAVIRQSFDELVLNEIRVENHYRSKIYPHLVKEGDEVYQSQVLEPGGLFKEDIRQNFFLAVVSQSVYKSDSLVEDEISLTETEILENCTVEITGSKWDGYIINLL